MTEVSGVRPVYDRPRAAGRPALPQLLPRLRAELSGPRGPRALTALVATWLQAPTADVTDCRTCLFTYRGITTATRPTQGTSDYCDAGPL